MGRREELEEVARYVETHDLSEEMEDGEWVEPDVPEPMITMSLRLPKTTSDALRAVARAQGVRPTQLMRAWIEERLAQETGPEDESMVSVHDLIAWAAKAARRIEQAGSSSRGRSAS
jgi:hypothetical protein